MAGQSTIGSLFVNLGINTAQFNKGLAGAQSKLGGFGSALKSFALGALGALSIGAITKAFSSVIDKADELGKTAQKIGLPTEELSKLKFAADLADVSLEQLSVGVGILSKGMASIAGGGTGEKVGPALAAIGVSAVDAAGKLRPTIDVIGDVAEKFALMEDGAGKTSLAMAIFGRSGKELIPLLNAGRDGLAEAAAEAEKLGIVIDEKTAKASERFNDNLTRLGAAMQGLTTGAVKNMIGSMADLTDAFVRLVEDGSTDAFFAELDARIQTTIKEFNQLIKVAQTVGSIFKFLSTENPEATGAFEQSSKEIGEIWDGTRESIEASTKALADIDSNPGKAPIKKIAAPIIVAPDPAAVAATKKALADIKRGQEELADSGQRVFDQTRTPIEAYQLEIQELDRLLKAGAITQDTYNRAVARLKTNFAEVGEAADGLGRQLGETIGSKIEDVFGQAIDGTLNLKDALKDLVNQLAKVAFSNVFQGLFGAGNPAQGGGFFGSLGKLFGFAKGGTIFPGGSGGVDSQLVAFRKSPNERVDITKPGQSLTSGGTAINFSIDARGADAGQIALLRRDLSDVRSNLARNVISIVSSEKSKNPRFAT